MLSLHAAPARILATATLAIGMSMAAPIVPADAGCPPESPALCRELGKSQFVIDSYGNVDWRASRGPATKFSDFGDPESDSHYFLCVWDGNGLLVAADIPPGAECPGGSCWSEKNSTDLKFRDEAGYNSDLRTLVLSGGRKNRTKLRAQTLVIGGINLPVTGDLLVQLSRADSSICFESMFPADAFTLNYKGEARATTSKKSQARAARAGN
ncbi:MAG: hypothetical protein ABR587_00855 [Candidatus Binatia bacterium]